MRYSQLLFLRFQTGLEPCIQGPSIFLSDELLLQALLWSWVVGKWGGRKGIISQGEKAKMWTELGGETGKEKKVVAWPKRESRLHVKEQLESAGLPDSGPTNYAFGTQSSPIIFSFYVLN